MFMSLLDQAPPESPNLQPQIQTLYYIHLSFQAVQQSLCDAFVVSEKGDEVGRDADDRRACLPHLQRPLPRRQHPRGLRDQLQTTHGDLKPGMKNKVNFLR